MAAQGQFSQSWLEWLENTERVCEGAKDDRFNQEKETKKIYSSENEFRHKV